MKDLTHKPESVSVVKQHVSGIPLDNLEGAFSTYNLAACIEYKYKGPRKGQWNPSNNGGTHGVLDERVISGH